MERALLGLGKGKANENENNINNSNDSTGVSTDVRLVSNPCATANRAFFNLVHAHPLYERLALIDAVPLLAGAAHEQGEQGNTNESYQKRQLRTL